jgi:hypothetical protein
MESRKLSTLHSTKTDIPVHAIGKAELPASSLVFVKRTREGFEGLVIDMASWGISSIVTGTGAELAKLFDDVNRGTGRTGIGGVCFVGGGLISDIVEPIDGPKGPPIGGGGPRGYPGPVLLGIIEGLAQFGAK